MILLAALSGCTPQLTERDMQQYVQGLEMPSPVQTIDVIDYKAGDGWSDGSEYRITYRICDGGDAANRCREKAVEASFALIDGGWRPIYGSKALATDSKVQPP